MPTYITGDDNDVVYASDRSDVIRTNGGDDEIRAKRGNDVVYAGNGSDFVDAGDGNDVVYAEAGNDRVIGGNGDDEVRGGAGEDSIEAGDGDDDVDGGDDFDVIDGGAGNDRLFGGSHMDVITTGTGADLVYGGSGNDVIYAADGAAGDRLYGDGYESLEDFLKGRPVTPYYGNDVINGGAGNDVIYGDSGTNAAAGGDDYLFGGAGNDTIDGEGGNDYVEGGEGRDTLRGGYGDDLIFGGQGADVLTGGAGADLFNYSAASESSLLAADRITDFVRGDDRIVLPVSAKLAWGGTTPTSRGVWYAHAFGQTHVFVSTNDDSFPEMRITLDGMHNLAPTDFWGVVGDKPPDISHDSNFVFEDDVAPVTGNVLANDLGEGLQVTGVSFGGAAATLGAPLRGQYGTLVLEASGAYTYVLDNSLPAVQALAAGGSPIFDSFTYTAADPGGSSSAVLGIQIVGRNDAPTATAASIVTNEDAAVSGTLPPATDVDGNFVMYSLGAQAANGTAIVNVDGSFSYTPNPGFSGTDSFVFRVSDGAASNEYAATVTVVDGNDAPFVANYGVPAGIVRSPIGSGASQDVAGGMVVQPDGKVLLAGSSSSPATNQDFSLARHNADGTIDTTFGNNGFVITPIGISLTTDTGTSVALQADGKILVAGRSNSDFALIRYNEDGSLDTTFGGGDGIVTTPVGPGAANDQAFHLAVQSDGKIVLVGSTIPPLTVPVPPVPLQADTAVVRYNGDGSLDTTFGNGGIVITPLSPAGNDAAQAVVSLADARLIVAGAATGASDDFALVRYTETGSLDTTFGGGDGIVTTPVLPTSDSARALLQQADGRIVVVGVAIGSNPDFAIVRYDANGTLDPTFGGGDGIVTTPFSGTSQDTGMSVAQQADDKLLVAGTTNGPTGTDFALVRYDIDGNLDPTFGAGGKVVTNLGPGFTPDAAVAISVLADGKILVGGNSQTTFGSDFALARYNADGSLDATFRAEERIVAHEGSAFTYVVPADRFADPDGDALTFVATQSDGSALPNWLSFDAATRTLSGVAPAGSPDTHVRVTATDAGGLSASYTYWLYTNTLPTSAGSTGVVTTNASSIGLANDQANAVALQRDGKILLAGISSTTSGLDTTVARYNADGSLDLTFGGGDGIAHINTNSGSVLGPSTDNGRGMVVQADGRILVVSATTTGAGGNDIGLSRLNADGTLDTTFGGGDGIVTTSIAAGTGADAGASVTLQADGKILVAGNTTTQTGGTEIAIVRYNTDGSLDTTFDLDGFAILGTGPAPDDAFSIKTQADGKIVVSGYGSVTGGTQFIVARFNVDGSRDSTFGTNGVVATDLGTGVNVPGFPESGQSLAILPDGSILVVGHAPSTSVLDIALVRYTSAGTLDTSFGTGGIVKTAAGLSLDLGFSVALQADGRIVVAGGAATAAGGPDIAVLRYLPNGSLDTSFGEDGIVTTTIATGIGSDLAFSVAVQPDGRIVIGGSSVSPAGTLNDFTLVRYNTDGSLDTTFGGLGNPTVQVDKTFTWSVPPRAFSDGDNDTLTYTVTRADGTPLPSWLTFNGSVLTGKAPLGTPDLELRVTATDPSGGTAHQLLSLHVENPNDAPVVASGVSGGFVLTPVGPSGASDIAGGFVLQPDGKILSVGQTTSPQTAQDFALVRHNADGSLDTTFGGDGIVISPINAGTVTDFANSVALQADGKILVAGMASGTGSFDFALARYNPDGSFDATFGGGDGIVTTAIGPAFSRDEPLRVTVQSDGKIVVVGYAQNSTAFPSPPQPAFADIAVVRYNADGTLDTSFSGDGVLTTEIGTGQTGVDVASSVLVQADGSILVGGYATLNGTGTGQDFALLRYTAGGVLDTAFGGGDGIVTTAVAPGAGNDVARSMLQQPDGRIVLVGNTALPNSAGDFAIARYNANGTPDATFGSNGVVVHSLTAGNDTATGVALQADGKLLVGGWTFNLFAIARYNVNGTLDTTFGNGGVVMTTLGPSSGVHTAVGMAVAADGKIVLGGYGSPTQNGAPDFLLARYNADGTMDPTFRGEERLAATEGSLFSHTVPADRFVDPDADTLTYSAAQSDGSALPDWLSFDATSRTFSGTPPELATDLHIRVTATDPAGLSASYAYWIYGNHAPTVIVPSGIVTTNVTVQDSAIGVALQADGKIVLTGAGLVATSDTSVLRYNTDGSLDLTFAGRGIALVNTNSTPPIGSEQGRALLVQPDGRIVVASNSGNDIAVSRFIEGFQDGSFDTDGFVTTSVSAGVDTVAGIAWQDGKLVVVGKTTSAAGDAELMLVRYNLDGSLDTSFGGGDGIAIPGFNANADEALAVQTQADGKIVVSGYSTIAPNEHAILVARFDGDGALDTAFDSDGIVTTDIGPGIGGFPSGIVTGVPFEAGQSLVVQPDGRIVVAGFGPIAEGRTGIALVRYETNGSLDTTFGTNGIVTTAVGTGSTARALSVALQDDGRIVVGGSVVTPEGGGDFAILRYDSDGSLDTSFGGGDGVATVTIGPIDQLNAIAIQGDGRIVAVGSTSFVGTGNDASAVRLNADGSLDTSFGGIGSPVANTGQPFLWTVQRFFSDPDNDALTYTMKMADGSPLPSWLNFTTIPVQSLALAGTPPAGTGDLALRLTATDAAGASASQYFVIDIAGASAPPDDGDTFVFDDGFGSAMVTGFTAGDASGDVLDLAALTNPEWNDFADILARTTQIDGNAFIDLGDGNSITLVGVTKASLTADDFNL